MIFEILYIISYSGEILDFPTVCIQFEIANFIRLISDNFIQILHNRIRNLKTTLLLSPFYDYAKNILPTTH